MRLLLDTHTLLWYALGDPRLSPIARSLIMASDNEVFISPASYWEIAIKVSMNNLTLHTSLEDFIDRCLSLYDFQILPIEPVHAARLATLIFPTKHKDPFDRLLIAQAIVEGIPIVGVAAKFDDYPVIRLW